MYPRAVALSEVPITFVLEERVYYLMNCFRTLVHCRLLRIKMRIVHF